MLVYLYNPFAEPVVRALAERLKKVYATYPACVEVIYQESEHWEAFEHEFRLTWSKALGMSEEETASNSASSAGDESRAYRFRYKARSALVQMLDSLPWKSRGHVNAAAPNKKDSKLGDDLGAKPEAVLRSCCVRIDLGF